MMTCYDDILCEGGGEEGGGEECGGEWWWWWCGGVVVSGGALPKTRTPHLGCGEMLFRKTQETTGKTNKI